MAATDILPWQSPHVGTVRVQHFRLKAGESFLVGEPVSVDDTGFLTQSADDPADADLIGIAAANGDTTATSDAPSASHIQTSKIYPTTAEDGFPNTGDLIPVWMIDPTSYWITSNDSEDNGGGTPSVPALDNLGDRAALILA